MNTNLPEFYSPEIHAKAWGRELWIRNGDKYCGKILQFDSGAKFSVHYHGIKEETWYISKGKFIMNYIDTTNAKRKSIDLNKGDVIHLYPLTPHQLICMEEGEIFEVSTKHDENDSYRIESGNSQK
jgi:mannose-6-phosphate isomerase-like protein (cupin superfamily)